MIKNIVYKITLSCLLYAPMVDAMKQVELSINHHVFYLEVPESTTEYEQGLMYRKTIRSSHGMIFLFDPKAKNRPSMWMKNTYISLDMLFIDPNYKITCIIQHTKPLSLELLRCDSPVAAVIELNAGDVGRFYLEKGMALKGT